MDYANQFTRNRRGSETSGIPVRRRDRRVDGANHCWPWKNGTNGDVSTQVKDGFEKGSAFFFETNEDSGHGHTFRAIGCEAKNDIGGCTEFMLGCRCFEECYHLRQDCQGYLTKREGEHGDEWVGNFMPAQDGLVNDTVGARIALPFVNFLAFQINELACPINSLQADDVIRGETELTAQEANASSEDQSESRVRDDAQRDLKAVRGGSIDDLTEGEAGLEGDRVLFIVCGDGVCLEIGEVDDSGIVTNREGAVCTGQNGELEIGLDCRM